MNLQRARKKIGKLKFDFDYMPIMDRSKVLKQIQTQKSLNEFF